MIDLYIHIGHPKCGSSTIQNFLYHNWESLHDQGFGIIDSNIGLFNLQSKNQPPVPYFSSLIKGDIDISSFTKSMASLAGEAEKTGMSSLILSSENLARVGMAKNFVKLKDYFNCHFIYYIRRQDDWIISSWKQWMMKEGVTLESYVKSHMSRKLQPFRRNISEWEETLQPTSMSIRYLHKKFLVAGDLIQDFCEIVGVEYLNMNPVPDSNKRLDSDLLHTLAQMPFAFEGRHDNRLFALLEDRFGDSLNLRVENPLSNSDRKKILEHFSEENDWLKENYFASQPFDDWLKIDESKPFTPYNAERGQLLLSGILLKLMLDINFNDN